MKKLIVFSVIFAMLATAAFAEVSVGAGGWAKATLFAGSSFDGDADPVTGGWGSDFNAQFSAEDEEGTFGGHFRIKAGGDHSFGYIWWKPIEQFRLWIGHNHDGDYGADDVVGWGFHENANDILTMHAYDYGAAFDHGYNSPGLALNITPIEGLAINLAVPFGVNSFHGGKDAPGTHSAAKDGDWVGYNSNWIGDLYGRMFAQVSYNIADTGKFTLTFKSAPGYREDEGPQNSVHYETDTPYLAAGFILSAVENLTVNIGVGFNFPLTIPKDGWMQYKTPFKDTAGDPYFVYLNKGTWNKPISIGLGVEYKAGDFGIKTRLQAQVGESFNGYEVDDDGMGGIIRTKIKVGLPTSFRFNLMPYFDLGVIKAFLNVGMEATSKMTIKVDGVELDEAQKKVLKDSDTFSIYVNPYIAKSIGSGMFRVGFQLQTTDLTEDKSGVSWAIPIGFNFGF